MVFSNLRSLYRFYINDLIFSKLFLIAFCVVFLSPVIVITSLYFSNSDFFYYSYLLAIILSSIFMIFTFIIINKLFGDNKTNFSDINIISKHFSRNSILFAKISLSILILFFSNLIILIISYIILFSFKLESTLINAINISNFVGIIINLLIIVPIFIIISITLKQIWFSIISFLIIFALIFTSFTGNFILSDTSKNNNLVAKENENTRNTYANLIKVDNDGKQIDNIFAVSTNFNSNTINNINDNFRNNMNNVNPLINAMPGALFFSAQQQFFSSLIKEKSLDYFSNYKNYRGSLVRYVGINKENVNNFISENGNFFYVSLPIFEKSIFELSTENLQSELKNSIDEIISKTSELSIINLNNSIEISNALTILNDSINNNWNTIDSTVEGNKILNTISALIGNKTSSSLYYLWKYNSIAINNLGNIKSYISNIYSSEFWNLLDYIWNNSNVNTNINISNFRNLADDLAQIYPNHLTFDLKEPISTKDLNFFKNTLLNFLGDNNPILLDINNNYVPINKKNFLASFGVLDENANAKNSWETYLNSKPSYENISLTYLNLKNLNANIVSYFNDENSLNSNTFNYVFSVESTTFLDKAYIPLIVGIVLGFFLIIIIFPIYKKLQYKI